MGCSWFLNLNGSFVMVDCIAVLALQKLSDSSVTRHNSPFWYSSSFPLKLSDSTEDDLDSIKSRLASDSSQMS